jgi:hypothetical protein
MCMRYWARMWSLSIVGLRACSSDWSVAEVEWSLWSCRLESVVRAGHMYHAYWSLPRLCPVFSRKKIKIKINYWQVYRDDELLVEYHPPIRLQQYIFRVTHLPPIYSIRPKINAILALEFCPVKNATLTNQLEKTRGSRSFSHKRQANL